MPTLILCLFNCVWREDDGSHAASTSWAAVQACLVHNYMDARPVSQPWSLKCTVRDALFRCFVTGCEDRCEAAAAAQVDESL